MNEPDIKETGDNPFAPPQPKTIKPKRIPKGIKVSKMTDEQKAGQARRKAKKAILEARQTIQLGLIFFIVSWGVFAFFSLVIGASVVGLEGLWVSLVPVGLAAIYFVLVMMVKIYPRACVAAGIILCAGVFAITEGLILTSIYGWLQVVGLGICLVGLSRFAGRTKTYEALRKKHQEKGWLGNAKGDDKALPPPTAIPASAPAEG